MPYNFDFSKIEYSQTMEINPIGWVSPLFVEYGIYCGEESQGHPSYFWRVKGTTHTFVIPTIRLDFLSKGNYRQHFEYVLENFREDYISWIKKQDNNLGWISEYVKQYSRFIII